jgi:hypothetical protein
MIYSVGKIDNKYIFYQYMYCTEQYCIVDLPISRTQIYWRVFWLSKSLRNTERYNKRTCRTEQEEQTGLTGPDCRTGLPIQDCQGRIPKTG